MSIPEIPLDLANQLKDHLASGDVSKIETAYKSGGLDWLKGHLSPADWVELPKRIVAKDLAWIRNLLGGLSLPGVGKLFGGASDAAGSSADAVTSAASSVGSAGLEAVGGIAAAAAGGAGILALAKTLKDKIGGKDIDWNWLSNEHKSGKLDWLKEHLSVGDWAELPKRIASRDASWIKSLFSRIELPGVGKLLAGGAAVAAVGGAAKLATTKKGGLAWWKWLIPLLVLAAIIALAATKCGSSTKTASDTTVVPLATTTATTVAATTATTVAAAVTTTAAPATTAAATTTSAAATTTTAVPATTAAATTTVAPAAPGDLLSVATGAGKFTTLAKLLADAGLTDTLKGAGPFTVFAPTDEAFAKLPKATLDALAANKDLLKKVLSYHVVAGNVKTADLKAGDVKTVNGANFTVAITGGKVTVNGANVTTADIAAKNGTIHVLDAVLLPAGAIPAPAATTTATLVGTR